MLKKRLGDLLLESNLITEKQLIDCLSLQKKLKKQLGEILVEEGIVEEIDLIQALEFQLGIPHIDLEKYYIDPETPRVISEDMATNNVLIPIKIEHGRLLVAMANPLDHNSIEDVRLVTGMEVVPVISTKSSILLAIQYHYENEITQQAIAAFKEEDLEEQLEQLEDDILDKINEAPLVRLVNSIIKHAAKSGASDIHIEPFESRVRVRFRIDGELQEVINPSKTTHAAMVTRIKIMGKMNIAEKRIPQDGRIELNLDGHEIDLRISSMPTIYGEKIVLRILSKSAAIISKKELGFTDVNLKRFEKIIANPNGIILVTGPTGSGKTTTLYAVLKDLNKINRNVITVENPVEYRLEGIIQVQVNAKAGLTFASALRSILRQDPDIIMIGEIRDKETAQISVRASITGHLVLSTMHTNDTASTITRLLDMGIESYLLSSSIVGVIAQRLVRKICTGCKIVDNVNAKNRAKFNIPMSAVLYKGEGCNKCNQTGYKGRAAIHEVMLIDDEIKELIDNNARVAEIKKTSIEHGMITLKQNCIDLVLRGLTTIDEMAKVVYSLNGDE
ncbi:MAG: GspE/PulE family protein [Clostridiales bacterium]|nr:GspE/PulE family protein [Clostridiales bacterium]